MARFPAAFEDKTGKITRLTGELEYLPDPAATPGDVLTVQPDGSVAAAPGGGSVAGATIVRAFPFAFDTPDLLTGAAIGYTPNVGDVLLDAWFEVDTAWDGTTPKADLGMFLDGDTAGYFYSGYDVISLANPDIHHNAGGYLTGESASSGTYTYALSEMNRLSDQGREGAPGKFTQASPICVCVTQNGQPGGSDPGSMQGAAILYLVTATPA